MASWALTRSSKVRSRAWIAVTNKHRKTAAAKWRGRGPTVPPLGEEDRCRCTAISSAWQSVYRLGCSFPGRPLGSGKSLAPHLLKEVEGHPDAEETTCNPGSSMR